MNGKQDIIQFHCLISLAGALKGNGYRHRRFFFCVLVAPYLPLSLLRNLTWEYHFAGFIPFGLCVYVLNFFFFLTYILDTRSKENYKLKYKFCGWNFYQKRIRFLCRKFDLANVFQLNYTFWCIGMCLLLLNIIIKIYSLW